MALNVYTTCNPIANGCTLYTNDTLSTTVSNGEYSDGTNVYTVTGGAGVISSTTACVVSTDLFIYAKYVSSGGSLAYSLNGGSKVDLGSVGSGTCTFFTTLSGLTAGDSVEFSGTYAEALSGDSTGCPSGASGCTYTVTIASGANYAYITINGSISC